MTPPAGRAALAAAIHDHLGDWATEATDRIVRQLHHDGWQISPQPPGTGPAGPRAHDPLNKRQRPHRSPS